MSNFKKIDLETGKHFIIIDSPCSFELLANPFKSSSRPSGWSGTDSCIRMSGAWQIDTWKLLPEKYQKNNPVFNLSLIYDADLLHEGEEIQIHASDIDLGEGIAGVNGQDVNIVGSSVPIKIVSDNPISIDWSDFQNMKFDRPSQVSIDDLRNNCDIYALFGCFGALFEHLQRNHYDFEEWLPEVTKNEPLDSDLALDSPRWLFRILADLWKNKFSFNSLFSYNLRPLQTYYLPSGLIFKFGTLILESGGMMISCFNENGANISFSGVFKVLSGSVVDFSAFKFPQNFFLKDVINGTDSKVTSIAKGNTYTGYTYFTIQNYAAQIFPIEVNGGDLLL